MKKNIFTAALLISSLLTFSGCSVVGGIFKTGMGIGIFISVVVVGLIIWLVSRMGKNK